MTDYYKPPTWDIVHYTPISVTRPIYYRNMTRSEAETLAELLNRNEGNHATVVLGQSHE